MHDVLAHRISLLAVHAGALEVRRSAPAGERRAAGVVRQCAAEALEELRGVLGMLREGGPEPEPPQPGLADIPALVEESRLAGMPVELDDRRPGGYPVPDGIGRHAYRIVQEGLTNTRKHARGAPVRVRLAGPAGEARGAGRGLVVEVTNALPGGTGNPVGARPTGLPAPAPG
jgi:signal transduction histidine kinase